MQSKNLGQKMPYLCIFRLKFEKTFVETEISILQFFKTQIYVRDKKGVKFGTKIALFGYSCAAILKIYYHI